MQTDHMDTRTRILDVTVNMLEQQKGKGVRMADIAKQAGVSRQAVYLHFASRTELLEATTKHLDNKLDLDNRLKSSRVANAGEDRLDLYIEFWGNYIPEIYGVAKALILMMDSDDAAAAAWKDRMLAMREGCRAAIELLQAQDKLSPEWTIDSAIDLLWTMLSLQNWENLTLECGWSKQRYVHYLKTQARQTFVTS